MGQAHRYVRLVGPGLALHMEDLIVQQTTIRGIHHVLEQSAVNKC